MESLQSLVGKEFGPSQWLEIDQARINAFADATGDHQFIHVNPELAQKTPFGTTIAHGFLTLSLIPGLVSGLVPIPAGVKMGVNYGSDKVRFLTPVKVNSRVRALVKVLSVEERHASQMLLKQEVTIEIEGETKPALVAVSLGLLFY